MKQVVGFGLERSSLKPSEKIQLKNNISCNPNNTQYSLTAEKTKACKINVYQIKA